jgi:hypothetical protein
MSAQMLQPGQTLWAVKQSHIKKAPSSVQLLVGASSLTLFENAKMTRSLGSIQFGRIVSSKANTKRLLLQLQAPNQEIALFSREAKQIKTLLKEQQHSFQQELARQEEHTEIEALKAHASTQLTSQPGGMQMSTMESAGERADAPGGPTDDSEDQFASPEDDNQLEEGLASHEDADVRIVSGQDSKQDEASSKDDQGSGPLINPASTWVELEDEDGDLYYFDRASQQTSWDRPAEGVATRAGFGAATVDHLGSEEDWSSGED